MFIDAIWHQVNAITDIKMTASRASDNRFLLSTWITFLQERCYQTPDIGDIPKSRSLWKVSDKRDRCVSNERDSARVRRIREAIGNKVQVFRNQNLKVSAWDQKQDKYKKPWNEMSKIPVRCIRWSGNQRTWDTWRRRKRTDMLHHELNRDLVWQTGSGMRQPHESNFRALIY